MTHLRHSFQHLPGISAKKEHILWSKGITDWVDLLNSTPAQLDLYRRAASSIESAVAASEKAYADQDIAYFAKVLPKRELYRVARTFPDRCIFLDIESTGLSSFYDTVTVVGWSIGDKYTAIIEPEDLQPLEDELRQNRILVTFNGALFDLPFLSKKFSTSWSDIPHIDLRFLSKRVGLTGGQKKIEVEIGATRDDVLVGISGAEAVSLWFDYKEGSLSALEKLIRYNHADIEGMKLILEHVISKIEPVNDTFSASNVRYRKSKVSFRRNSTNRSNGHVLLKPYLGRIGPNRVLAELLDDYPLLGSTPIVGIDLTGSEKRKTGWALVAGEAVETALISTDEEILQRTLSNNPCLVSIDSPLSLPDGRTTEFDDDPGRDKYGIVRQAERQLRRRGINVYPALLPSMQKLTQRGVMLASALRKRGVPVIESYPGAAQDILGIPRKQTSLKYLLQGLHRFGYQSLAKESELSHDELDAVTSALVGQFMLSGYWEALGTADEDYLIVPTVDRIKIQPEMVVGLSGSIAAGKTTVANFLENQGFHYCRFSQILEQELRDEGKQVNRQSMQELGARIHSSRFGQRKLQNKLATLVEGSQKIVVDGLRHPEDHAFLVERWGLAAIHLHIDASVDIRAQRYAMRTNTNIEEFHTAEAHEVEQNSNLLHDLADFRIINTKSKSVLEKHVAQLVQEFKCQ